MSQVQAKFELLNFPNKSSLNIQDKARLVYKPRPRFGRSAATKDKGGSHRTPNAFYHLKKKKNTNENMTGMTIRMTSLSQRYHNNILLTKFKESVSQNCYRNPIATEEGKL